MTTNNKERRKTVEKSNELCQKDLTEVGRAFAEALIPSIPNGIDELITLCKAHLEPIPDDRKKILMREPDAQAGGPSADALAAYGLTPAHIVFAGDAIGLWVERAIDAGFFRETRVILRYNNDLGAITTPRYPVRIRRLHL